MVETYKKQTSFVVNSVDLIFISHTKADKQLVEPIALKLATVYGKESIFYDSWAVQPGDGIIDKMNEGLTKCKFFFFFVSKNSIQSKMVKLEWQNAIIRATNGEVKLIPVKLDDCLMPSILLQNMYINFHNYGPETAIRQMIDVIEGRNIFREGEIQEFQNIRAYVSDIDNGFRIEFRAEAYMEPQSKFVILFTDGTKDDVDCSVEGVSFPIQYVEKSSVFNKYIENAFIVSRANPTSPGFPFVVTFKPKTSKIVQITGLMRATSSTTASSIPTIYKDRTFIPK